MKTATERLFNRILIPKNLQECFKWAGGKNNEGYGRFRMNGKKRGAHRVVYELFNGPIPEGLQIDHLCRNRGCVNASHLEAVTGKENQARGKVNQYKGITHCKRGHEFTAENTYAYKNGRACRACRALHFANWWRVNK